MLGGLFQLRSPSPQSTARGVIPRSLGSRSRIQGSRYSSAWFSLVSSPHCHAWCFVDVGHEHGREHARIEARLAQPRGHGTWGMDMFKKLGHEMVSTPQPPQLGKTWDIVWKGRGSGYAIHEFSLIQCSRFRTN